MQALIQYTAAPQAHTHVRCERIPASGGTWSEWQTVPTGNQIAPMSLSTGSAFNVRLISVNQNTGVESTPSSPISVSYADGQAALNPPPPTLDPPSNVGVVYSA